MPTDNTKILTKDDIEIRVDENIPCGQAYLLDVSYLTDPKAIAFVGECKTRFLGFVCCEKQRKDCTEHLAEVVAIINRMIGDKIQAFVSDNHRTFH